MSRYLDELLRTVRYEYDKMLADRQPARVRWRRERARRVRMYLKAAR